MSIRCPKCRALGLDTDCSDLLIHAHRSDAMMRDDDSGYDLDVTFTFTVPVTSTLDRGPHEMATHMRELWITEETQLQDVLLEAVNGEFDLQVAPVFGL